MTHKENLHIKGHTGTWYVIAQEVIQGTHMYLLESEQYGEDAPSIIVNSKLEVILENVYNGFDDLLEQLEEEE